MEVTFLARTSCFAILTGSNFLHHHESVLYSLFAVETNHGSHEFWQDYHFCNFFEGDGRMETVSMPENNSA